MKNIFKKFLYVLAISGFGILVSISIFSSHARAAADEPIFGNFIASPNLARSGMIVDISFVASTAPVSAVSLTINGNKTTENGFDATTLTYDFGYTVNNLDPTGPAKIQVSLADPNEAFVTDQTESSAFEIDNTAPVAPVISNLANVDLTNQNAFVISGDGEVGATVSGQISDDSNGVNSPVIVPGFVVLPDGSFILPTIDLSSLKDGPLVLILRQTDQAGNVGEVTIPKILTKDTSVKTIPVQITLTGSSSQATTTVQPTVTTSAPTASTPVAVKHVKKIKAASQVSGVSSTPTPVESQPTPANTAVAQASVVSFGGNTSDNSINWSTWIIFLIIVILVSLLAAAGYYGYEWIVASGQSKSVPTDIPVKQAKIEKKIEEIADKEKHVSKDSDDRPKTRW